MPYRRYRYQGSARGRGAEEKAAPGTGAAMARRAPQAPPLPPPHTPPPHHPHPPTHPRPLLPRIPAVRRHPPRWLRCGRSCCSTTARRLEPRADTSSSPVALSTSSTASCGAVQAAAAWAVLPLAAPQTGSPPRCPGTDGDGSSSTHGAHGARSLASARRRRTHLSLGVVQAAGLQATRAQQHALRAARHHHVPGGAAGRGVGGLHGVCECVCV